MATSNLFDRYIGIDYSGANTPVARLNGLAVYQAGSDALPGIVFPQTDDCDLWSRKLLAQWLVERLKDRNKRILVGIDHGFGFPIAYFEKYSQIPRNNWECFLRDFQEHWPTDGDDGRVSDIKGDPDQQREGDGGWLRLTDTTANVSSSVFRFTGAGQVGHSTHAGLPWLLYIRQELCKAGAKVHFWPFDGWVVCPDQSVVVEVYPRLWNRLFRGQTRGMNEHRRDAYSVARWMSENDQNGCLGQCFDPGVPEEQKDQARTEGWIFGAQVHN